MASSLVVCGSSYPGQPLSLQEFGGRGPGHRQRHAALGTRSLSGRGFPRALRIQSNQRRPETRSDAVKGQTGSGRQLARVAEALRPRDARSQEGAASARLIKFREKDARQRAGASATQSAETGRGPGLDANAVHAPTASVQSVSGFFHSRRASRHHRILHEDLQKGREPAGQQQGALEERDAALEEIERLQQRVLQLQERTRLRLQAGAHVAAGKFQDHALQIQGRASEAGAAVQERASSMAGQAAGLLQDKQQELERVIQERATELQGLAVDRASSVATNLQARGHDLERVVQERALELERHLPPQTQRALRASAHKAQQVVALVGQQVDKLPLTRSQFAMILGGAIIIIRLMFDWWHQSRLDAKGSSGFDFPERPRPKFIEPPPPPAPVALMRAEPDLRRKEPVEWVNMILRKDSHEMYSSLCTALPLLTRRSTLKVFKIYRTGLERWMVSVLQPSLDDMQKPPWVRRVRVMQFFLGDEPPSLRTIERRTSRRGNDLQYHIGLRYTGDMRFTIEVPIQVAGLAPFAFPVGMRDFDIDAEIWCKLKLIPVEPWVGTLTWAFVSRPKIKLSLAPFSVFNLMKIPFLSRYLETLFTEDLPSRFVRPNFKVVDLLKGRKEQLREPFTARPEPGAGHGAGYTSPGSNGAASGSTAAHMFRDFSSSEVPRAGRSFSGELSVTLIAAQDLPVVPYTVSDPYVVMELGQQIIKSKRNLETSIIGPRGAPIWNQDFQLLVVNQAEQPLRVRVRDTLGPLNITLGYGELRLGALQDNIPRDLWIPLRSGIPPIYERQQGEVKVRVTYKEFVEDFEETDDDDEVDSIEGLMEDSARGATLELPQLQSFVQDIADMAIISRLSTAFSEGAGQSPWAVSDLVKLGDDLARVASRARLASEQGGTASTSRHQDGWSLDAPDASRLGKSAPSSEQPAGSAKLDFLKQLDWERISEILLLAELRKALETKGDNGPDYEAARLALLERFSPAALSAEIHELIKKMDVGRREGSGIRLDLTSLQDLGLVTFLIARSRGEKKAGKGKEKEDGEAAHVKLVEVLDVDVPAPKHSRPKFWKWWQKQASGDKDESRSGRGL